MTDEDPKLGMVFLSARPEDEHHELLLCGGRNVDKGAMVLQQVSFRCDHLQDVIDYYRVLRENDVPLDMVVSHGNAVAIYFYDPDGNRAEVYWPTGLRARQPYLQGIDLTRPAAELIAEIEESVRLHGETGIVDMSCIEKQNIPAGA